ncbi:11014_t:CDS:2 [Dentiscutata erythropus]|uniref:11014_t:CDS:1 n=1 Tax=Dentiscutata erythropus TaxID=1348616 RepID=A0A9N9HWD2_9GLOM|nr:11014_t:CDS:2 [Dentiscutata erythropus]
MWSIVNVNYTYTQQDLYDTILNTLFPIILMKFLDVGLKNKDGKGMIEIIVELKEHEEAKIMIQGIIDSSDINELKVEYDKAQKKEILGIFNEILKELDEEINAYINATHVSTFKAIALPLLDDVLYHIVSWIIPLMAAFAYDDDDLSNLKPIFLINISLHATFSIFTIFLNFWQKYSS